MYAESRAAAEAALAVWQRSRGQDQKGLRWRYDKIKEIGRRSVPALSPHRERPARPSRRIGRNDPCPCGSGKKYKKCCGLAASRDSLPDIL